MLTFVVEDGSSRPDANSYASIEDADAYHEAHVNGQAWLTLDHDAKPVALVMATRLLDEQASWAGYPASPDQALAFPSVGNAPLMDSVPGYLYYDRLGRAYAIDEVPLPVIQATSELARVLATEGDVTANADAAIPSSLTLGPISVNYAILQQSKNRPILPAAVRSLIAPLVRVRHEVVRA